jgi:signal transduction histidine kinase
VAEIADPIAGDALNLLPGWWWRTDSDGRISALGAGFARRTGLPIRSAVGRTWIELAAAIAPERDLEPWREVDRRLSAHEPIEAIDLSVIANGGGTHVYRVSATPGDGEFFGLALDVTAEVAARADAERWQRSVRRMIAGLADAFALFDKDLRLLHWNEAYARHNRPVAHLLKVGVTLQELFRAAIAAGQYPESQEDIETMVARRAEQHRRGVGAFARRRPNGDIAYYRYIAIPDVGSATLISYISGREAHLESALESTAQDLRARNEFIANMGHELRTPLNAIIGFAELLQSEAARSPKAETVKEYLGDILASSEHLLQLVESVLDLSRLSAGRYQLTQSLIDPAHEADRCMAMMRPLAQKKGVELLKYLASDLPPVRADARGFRQIVINLLSNAIKFSRPGGSVRIGAAVCGASLRISIEDDGVGISPEALQRLGRPFELAESGLNRRHPGLGLGLALSRAIAEEHGGTLTVESELAKGTLVIVDIPLKPDRLEY